MSILVCFIFGELLFVPKNKQSLFSELRIDRPQDLVTPQLLTGGNENQFGLTELHET